MTEVIGVDQDLIDPPIATPPVFTATVKMFGAQSGVDIPAVAQATDLLTLFNPNDATRLVQAYWDTAGDLRILNQKGHLHLHAKGTNGTNGHLYVHNALDVTGDTTVTGAITATNTVATGAPAGGAGAWKLGKVNAVSPTAPNRTITVVVDGLTLYIAAKLTDD